jgi:hypothetical protein
MITGIPWAFGGKPSKGTSADHRLKANKGKPPVLKPPPPKK